MIFRCTYGSQEKWDTFLALAKQEAYKSLEQSSTGDLFESVYNKMDWTVIEDTGTLDGASIQDTTRKFRAWARAYGRAETQGSVPYTWQTAPRYHYFVHVYNSRTSSTG